MLNQKKMGKTFILGVFILGILLIIYFFVYKLNSNSTFDDVSTINYTRERIFYLPVLMTTPTGTVP